MGAAMTVTIGSKHSARGRTAATLVAVASLIMGVGVVSGVLLPAPRAGAATDIVTNCNSSGPGSLPDTVSAASSGDIITFNVSCPVITLTAPIGLSQNLTISGPGAGNLAVSGGGSVGDFTVGSGVTATISGLTIEDGAGASSWGNGIFNSGTLAVNDAVLSGNTSQIGGAIFNNTGATVTVADSTISGNSATEYSGAIHNDTGATATVTNSTVSGNSATQFGGAFDNDGSLTVANSTVAGNSAGSGGGGIEMPSGATATVTNSTFWDNSASFGGSLDNDGGTLDVQATIVAGSPSGSDCADSQPTDLGYNLDDDGSCGFTSGTGDLSNT